MKAESSSGMTEQGNNDEAGGDSPALPKYSELEPAGVWDVFALLSSIPRPSWKEAAVISALQDRCEEHGWITQTDAGGNLIVSVPATEGMEEVPSVILQGHVDIVAIKAEDSEHNFETDPIRLIVDDVDGKTIVRADRTTLGADNGIGVAMALAVAEDPSATHGPLELLFTVNEESGMTGASDLQAEDLESKYLINLDTEEDHVIYNGCVGGLGFEAVWNLEPVSVPQNAIPLELTVSGLLGGHSGLEIDDNRGNAIKVLADVLQSLGELNVLVQSIESGTFTNAIPSEARAQLWLSDSEDSLEALKQKIAAMKNEFSMSIGPNGLGLNINLDIMGPENGDGVNTAFQFSAVEPILKCIAEMPTGVLAMMDNGEDLESSANIAIVRTRENRIILKVSIRSLIKAKLFEYGTHYETIAEKYGSEAESSFNYPPWEPVENSTLLTLTEKVHEQVFGFSAKVGLIHGGLECGILSSKLTGTQMVSIGPLIEGAHTPKERVYVESVQKAHKLLKAILAKMDGLN